MNPDAPAILELEGVRFGYTARAHAGGVTGARGDSRTSNGDSRTSKRDRDFARAEARGSALDYILGPVGVTVRSGECWAIVGPNGAGKSTLLRLMAGLRRPQAGRITFAGQDLSAIPHRRRAQRIAFMPQQPASDLDLSVRDIVLAGRFPHRSYGLFESADDRCIADRAMELTQTTALADRPLATLSGGEAQRVHLAAAIAQTPELLLLDEPTASLDLQHQLGIFEILRGQARAARSLTVASRKTVASRMAVVVVTHDVNLATRFCTHVMLLHEGRQVATGGPGDVITPDVLAPVYGVELTTLASDARPDCRWVVPAELAGGGQP